MESTNLATQEYWDASYKNLDLFAAPSNDSVRLWIEKNIPANPEATCLEIGAYPGRYLPIFGKLGYTLNGVDLAPGTTDRLPDFLVKAGYSIGQFFQIDATEMQTVGQYDVVCSFGFIEHFKNYKDIIIQHARLVKPGGLLILTTPNFGGHLQYSLHQALDLANLKRHNVKAMNVNSWSAIVETQGFKIIRSEYFGKFDFWTDQLPSNFGGRLMYMLIQRLKPLLRLLPNQRSWSAYSGLIAERLS